MATRREWLWLALSAMGALVFQGRSLAALAYGHPNKQEHPMSTAEEILALERAAMGRWAKGDPDGFLALVAPDISYFDPFIDHEISSAQELTAYYNSFRGQVHIDRFEFVSPRVQVYGDTAILTYQFKSQGSEGSMHWNTTEVYRRLPAGWRIVHNHWAHYKPKIAA